MCKVNESCYDPNYFRTLVEGVIDNDAIDLFTNGYCLDLADAISQLTGWRIVVFTPNPGLESEILFHAAVLTPDLDYVDIEGPGALERWRDRESLEWNDHKISDSRPVGCDEALPWARAVLDKHFTGWESQR